MDNKKKEIIYNEDDVNFYQKPYSKNFPYNMVKMAAVEPICFYPNRQYIEKFNNREINMKKLADYIYQQKKEKYNANIEKDDDNKINNKLNTNNNENIIYKVSQPYYLPEYYNSTSIHQLPQIDILPTECCHETKKQYKQYEEFHYEEPAWTQAEKDLFNYLYNTIGKNFHKIAKEFENRATTVLIPHSFLKRRKIKIIEETKDNNIIASITPLSSKKNIDKNSFQCQALPNLNNNTIHQLVHNVKDDDLSMNITMQRENMIFPRKTSEIIHYYYKNKFKLPNWKLHKDYKITQRKNKKKI